MKRVWTIAFCALLLLVPAAWAQSTERPEGTIVIGAEIDAATLDPRLANDSTGYRVGDLLYSGLVHLTPDLKPVPDLAESWSVPDPTTWIFKLRPNLAFSDGTPLTAEDVAYTFETLADPAFKAPRRSLYEPIAKVEALDPLTVKFTLTEPYAPLLSYLDMGIVSKRNAQKVAGADLTPLGAGPLMLADWQRGKLLNLVPNPHYWGKKPAFDHVQFRIVEDIVASVSAFEAGKLDIIQSPLQPLDIEKLKDDSRYGHVITTGLGITYLNFNTSDPLLADPLMRRALSMFVDQETIVEQIYEGGDAIANGVLLPSSWAYSPDVRQPRFDVAGGLKLLGELGWHDSNGDGLLDRNGENLTITLATHSEDPNRVQTLVFLQATMQSAGIDAQLYVADWPNFSTGYVRQSKHQVALLGWLNIVDPDRVMFSQLSSGGANNWGRFSNPRLDELLKSARVNLDQKERAQLYRQAAGIVAQDLPYYVISAQGYQVFYRKIFKEPVIADPRGSIRGFLGLLD